MADFFRTLPVDGIEAMAEAVMGSDVEPTQLKPGAFRGVLTHAGLGTATLSAGSFSGASRMRGPLSNTTHTVGILLDLQGPSSQWAFQTENGDIGVIPPCTEHDARYGSRGGFVTLTLPLEELVERSAWYQPQITDGFWQEAAMYRPPPPLARLIVERFKGALREMEVTPRILQAPDARDALLDDLIRPLLLGCASAAGRSIGMRETFASSTGLVSKAEDYLHEQALRPVRTAELCRHLEVSERSLHRAFHQVSGLPPVIYLRRWRLSQVRRLLADPETAGRTVTDAALHFGFWELGRFAQQYRQLFGELPSQTLQRAGRERTAG